MEKVVNMVKCPNCKKVLRMNATNTTPIVTRCGGCKKEVTWVYDKGKGKLHVGLR